MRRESEKKNKLCTRCRRVAMLKGVLNEYLCYACYMEEIGVSYDYDKRL